MAKNRNSVAMNTEKARKFDGLRAVETAHIKAVDDAFKARDMAMPEKKLKRRNCRNGVTAGQLYKWEHSDIKSAFDKAGW